MAKNTKLEEFAKLSRSYREENGVIKKVFNRGQGLISLIEFSEKDGKKICIYNKLYANKKDIENIAEFFGNDYEIIGVELGYPDWYTKTLRTKYREKDNNFACGKGNFSVKDTLYNGGILMF